MANTDYRWPNSKRLRIDHFLLNSQLEIGLAGGGVDRAVRVKECASDYAPAWTTLEK